MNSSDGNKEGRVSDVGSPSNKTLLLSSREGRKRQFDHCSPPSHTSEVIVKKAKCNPVESSIVVPLNKYALRAMLKHM